MAFLKLGSAQNSLYENYEKVNTTALDRQVNYAVDTVRLNLASDKSDKTGKYMNPATYDNAIASLQALLKKPMSAAKKQDILTMIENYQVSRNSLQGSIDKVAGGKNKSVSQIINEIKNQRQNEIDMTKAALLGVAKSPADYAKKMSEIILGNDEDGQLSGTMLDVEKAIANQDAEDGYHSYELDNYRDELQQDFNKWRNVAEDPKIRSQYGLFIKPNAYGEWDGVDMLNIAEAPKEGYKAVANANLDGMPVYLQHGVADANGFVSTTLPDGTIIKTDGNYFEVPGYDGTQLLGGKALNYHPLKGDLIKVDGKDIYMFGGLNGESGKFQHVTTPEIMTRFGLWDKLNKSGGPKREFTKDEFSQYSEMVGDPINNDYINKSNQQILNDSLKKTSDNYMQYWEGIKPETVGEGIGTAVKLPFKGVKGIVTEGIPQLAEGIGTIVKGVPGAVETQAKGQQGLVETAANIFASTPKIIGGVLKGIGKGLFR